MPNDYLPAKFKKPTPAPKFKPGDRVTYSAEGLVGLLNVKNPNRVGEVVTVSLLPGHYRKGYSVRLQWPGRKVVDELHEDFLTIAPEEKDASEISS